MVHCGERNTRTRPHKTSNWLLKPPQGFQTPVKLSAPFDPSTLGIWEHAPRKEPRRKQNQERV